MELMNRAADLRRARTPYVMATVVRVKRPTSAKPGDRALILGDGTLEGFVGGACAESTVRLQGLRVLETGRSVLLRVRPGEGSGDSAGPGEDSDGLIVVDNPCLSGGSLDIFLEAVIPAPLIHVYGDSPIARTLTLVGRAAGYDVVAASAGAAMPADLAAVIVASHGRDEEEALAAAVRACVPYVALVASRKRGDAVLAEAGVAREQVHSPAGLDIGAKTPADVAISILAELILVRAALASNVEQLSSQQEPAVGVAIDPICQMEVAMTADAITAERDGQTYYFCGPGCKRAFLS